MEKLLYHVTFTRNVRRIKKHGILTFQTTNWVNGNGSRYGDGSIYAFESEHDAIRWAAKMDWDHYRKTGSGEIVILSFMGVVEKWEVDHADPLSQCGSKGRWLKSRCPIDPTSIYGARTFNVAMLKFS